MVLAKTWVNVSSLSQLPGICIFLYSVSDLTELVWVTLKLNQTLRQRCLQYERSVRQRLCRAKLMRSILAEQKCELMPSSPVNLRNALVMCVLVMFIYI